MGNLVFQATLGGQVNLVGPNTASTFNINVPATAGTMITTGDTGTVTNTMLASSAYTAPGTIGSGTPNSGAFTALSYTTTLTGGTGIVNLGSGQFYKDASGNVGIGTSSVTAKLNVNVSGAGSVTALNITNDNSGFAAGTGPAINFGVASSAIIGNFGKIEVLNQTATAGSNSYMTFSTRGGDVLSERARIDSSGNLLVGTTISGFGQSGIIILPAYNGAGNSGMAIQHSTGSASGSTYASFAYNAVQIGSVVQSGTTGVLYNITSDRRLKSEIVDFADSGAYIDAFKPRSFVWNEGTPDIGFITDEYQQVLPSAITGEPDAVDEEGNPIYQQGDFATSAKMAIIIAELKSLRKRVAELEAAK